MDGDRGPQTVMWSKEFYETDPSRGFVRGYTLQFGLAPVRSCSDHQSGHRRLPWGKNHHRAYRTLMYRRLLAGVACEDLPEEHNRVTLDPVLRTAMASRLRRLTTRSANTRRMMEHGIALARRRS